MLYKGEVNWSLIILEAQHITSQVVATLWLAVIWESTLRDTTPNKDDEG